MDSIKQIDRVEQMKKVQSDALALFIKKNADCKRICTRCV